MAAKHHGAGPTSSLCTGTALPSFRCGVAHGVLRLGPQKWRRGVGGTGPRPFADGAGAIMELRLQASGGRQIDEDAVLFGVGAPPSRSIGRQERSGARDVVGASGVDGGRSGGGESDLGSGGDVAGEGGRPGALRRRTRQGAALVGAGDDGTRAKAPALGGPRFVAIAGNMGAGKSTLTGFLASRFSIQPFYEPNDANPYLADFYTDMARYAFHSQIYFLSAKFRAHLQLRALMERHPGVVYAQDRTIYEDAEIFAATLARSGTMSERDFATYQAMYLAIRDSLPRPDVLIYLRCSVKGVRRRIMKRGRPEEREVADGYLRALHEAYETWFERYDLGPKLVVETERLDYLRDIVDQLALQTRLEQILGVVAQQRPDP